MSLGIAREDSHRVGRIFCVDTDAGPSGQATAQLRTIQGQDDRVSPIKPQLKSAT